MPTLRIVLDDADPDFPGEFVVRGPRTRWDEQGQRMVWGLRPARLSSESSGSAGQVRRTQARAKGAGLQLQQARSFPVQRCVWRSSLRLRRRKAPVVWQGRALQSVSD